MTQNLNYYQQLSLFGIPRKESKRQRKGMGCTNASFSIEQERIFLQARKSKQSILIEAVAGAGKTTTLVELSRRIDGTVLFCAFNKHIAEEIQERVRDRGNVTVSTIHALGLRTLGNPKVNNRKYLDLIRNQTRALFAEGMFLFPALFTNLKSHENNPLHLASQWLREVVTLGQSYLARGNEILQVLKDNNRGNLLINDEALVQTYELICQQSTQIYLSQNEVDFVDMIWLPSYLGRTAFLTKYDTVLIDETQDLNKAQTEIALSSVKPNGQIIAAGDPYQSIYGFAGADPRSMENFVKRTQAVRLPLSLCYRCPAKHIELAREYNPNIHPGKAEAGEILYWTPEEYYKNYTLGDLIIARRMVPIVELALELIGRNIPCRIKGREIANDTIQIINLTAPNPPNLIVHIQRIQQFFKELNQNLGDNIQAITQNNDKYLYIKTLLLANYDKPLSEIIEIINKLFTSDKANEASICLSTIHRAKGLEAERVVILNRKDMPLLFPGATPVEVQQEQNLLYVAHTRARKTLIFIDFSTKKSNSLFSIRQTNETEIDDFPEKT